MKKQTQKSREPTIAQILPIFIRKKITEATIATAIIWFLFFGGLYHIGLWTGHYVFQDQKESCTNGYFNLEKDVSKPDGWGSYKFKYEDKEHINVYCSNSDAYFFSFVGLGLIFVLGLIIVLNWISATEEAEKRLRSKHE